MLKKRTLSTNILRLGSVIVETSLHFDAHLLRLPYMLFLDVLPYILRLAYRREERENK